MECKVPNEKEIGIKYNVKMDIKININVLDKKGPYKKGPFLSCWFISKGIKINNFRTLLCTKKQIKLIVLRLLLRLL
jgi:hypothetical protein